MGTVKIVLADGYPVFRRGLNAVLKTEADFNVIGEAGNGVDALQLCNQLRPDVLMLDDVLPGINGLAIAKKVKITSPRVHIIMLSIYCNKDYAVEALQAGAEAYVLKWASEDTFVHAVREVLQGHCYFSPPIPEQLLNEYVENRDTMMKRLNPEARLSTRERQITYLIVDGLTTAEIAHRLCLSVRTVESHRANIAGKLGVTNQAELIRYALQRGFLWNPTGLNMISAGDTAGASNWSP